MIDDHEYGVKDGDDFDDKFEDSTDNQENVAKEHGDSFLENIVKEHGDSFLLELFKEREYFYNKNHPEFKNPELKQLAWVEMSQAMLANGYDKCYTPEYCQTRCTSLRTQYGRYKRNLSRSDLGIVTRKIFPYCKQLEFLDKFMHRRKIRNVNPLESADEDTPSSSKKKQRLSEYSSESGPSFQHVNLDAEVLSKNVTVVETGDLERLFTSVMEKITNYLDERRDAKDSETSAENAFGQFVAVRLQQMPEKERCHKRRQIFELIMAPYLERTATD